MDSKIDIRNKRWLYRWSRMRRKSFFRFCIVYGTLYFLAILLLINYFDLAVLNDIVSEEIWINMGIAVCFGILTALIQWSYNEIRYRRLGAKYPSAVRFHS
jgi:uncharacterized membrane protein YhaH (DUF805 family)